MKKQKTLAQIGMIVTTMIWGITFVMIKDALNDAGPYMFAFLRFGLACILGFVYTYNGYNSHTFLPSKNILHVIELLKCRMLGMSW